jgi:hypothetical protein
MKYCSSGKLASWKTLDIYNQSNELVSALQLQNVHNSSKLAWLEGSENVSWHSDSLHIYMNKLPTE